MDVVKVRAIKKMLLTKAIHKAERQMDDRDVDSLNKTLSDLATLFDDFDRAQDSYVSSLEDSDRIEAAELYYDNVCALYRHSKRHCISFLTGDTGPTENKNKHGVTTEETSSLVQALNLPRVEIMSFEGNPREYTAFITLFTNSVESATSDGQTRLTQLLHHTTGRARKSITPCIMEGGDAGYKSALKKLHDRFGSSHIICESVLSDLNSSGDVKTAVDIRNLADSLDSAALILKKHGKYTEVDTQNFILKICMKLKPQLRYKWRERATTHLADKDSYPTFQDFVDFIERHAHIYNDPIYGGDALQEPGRRSVATRNTSSFTAVADRKQCIVCNNDHKLFLCKKFRSFSVTDRIKIVNDHKLCKICLANNHSTAMCKSNYRCNVEHCEGKHSKLIHDNVSVSNNHCLTSLSVRSHNAILMPIVEVIVNDTYHTHALLDTGSSDSFCTKRMASALSLSGPSTTYSLNTLNTTGEQTSPMVHFNVASRSTHNSLVMKNIRVINSIPTQSASCDVTRYPHLTGMYCPGDVTVDLLIGQDFPAVLRPLDVKCGRPDEPFAVLSILGWTLNGPVASQATSRRVISHFVSSMEIEKKLDRLWEMENYDDQHCFSPDDARVKKLWDKECRVVDGHFELPVPWRDPTLSLPDNLYLSQSRLCNLLKSLKKKKMLSQYETEIEKMISNGYAEPVPDDVMCADRCFYLPHHAVRKNEDKIRIVFDCASKCRGVSLNSLCLQGPDLSCRLFDVLIRFREFPFALMADITAMYNQIKIPTRDRDALRFLWLKDNDIKQYRMTSHLFGGIWCSSSSSYALKKTSELTNDAIVKNIITSSFYVDDLLWSSKSLDEATRLMPKVKSLLSTRGFQLTKYIASHEAMLSGIPEDSRLRSDDDMLLCHSDKALGVGWCIMDDAFHIRHKLKSVKTKSQMLSSLASVFDPLGLIAPLHLPGKLMFQQVCSMRISWEDELPVEMVHQWNRWISSMDGIEKFITSRCLIPNGFQDAYCELHSFSDASQRAYGCCIYIRVVNKIGRIHTILVCSKARVNPKRAVTIPRLELQAAVLSVKMESSVRTALSFGVLPTYFWTDSEIVLAYIKNKSRRFNTFVSNRVSSIHNSTDPRQWHHVPGSDNPADMVSRGVKLSSIDQELWQHGPYFLRCHKQEWSDISNIQPIIPDGDPELKKIDTIVFCAAVNAHPIQRICEHFSNWKKVKRSIAWLIKFKSFLKAGQGTEHSTFLTVQDMKNAEVVICRYVQHKYFSTDFECIAANIKLRKNSHLKKLDPRLNPEGLLVVGGRLCYSSIGQDNKHPVILPYDHVVSTLIARDVHERCHLGREWILSLLRKHFWILRARSLVYKVCRDCLTCRRLFSKTCIQKMADLPEFRVDFDKRPFNHVSVDCFGPFYVKRGRSECKRYGCVFTCLNIRAIHIEKLDDLECDTFINSLRRFIARRGKPSKMLSDNGTNFTAASAELKRSLRQLNKIPLTKYCAGQNIEWSFHPPGASHMNGACERMIRTIRKVLTGMLTDRCRLTDDIINTLFTEVEAIVNHRPLTKVSDDVADDSPLTPAHLLMVRCSSQDWIGNFSQGDMYRRRWRYVQYLADVFWRRYINEYLPELQKRNKWYNRERRLKVGDLVLIMNEHTPRRLWPLGLVIHCKEGRDGIVRSARVKTQSSELVRPISKLVFLES